MTNKRKAESSDVSYKRKKQVEKRVSFRIHYGLQNLAPTLNTEASCDFPECNRPWCCCLLNGTVKFQGDSVIDGGDIIGLLGGNSADEENYLSNFVVDSYLKLISMESSMKGLSTVSLKWERFEKNVGKECARDVFKRKDGKASFLEHDLILTPCNEPGSKHWFLLVIKPKEKQMLVLDTLAGSFIKPSTARAMDKMWSVVKELDEDVNEWEWSFHTNTPRDIPQQQNGFDFGVFVCAYARNLALQSPVPCQTSVPSFRSVMLLELHNKAIYDFTEVLHKWVCIMLWSTESHITLAVLWEVQVVIPAVPLSSSYTLLVQDPLIGLVEMTLKFAIIHAYFMGLCLLWVFGPLQSLSRPSLNKCING